jgi:NAD(P)-dependent dehydrogenase (short-subunit alcohol dehydrogenase family)
MLTDNQGGTTGIGAATAFSLAQRGAQIILLTRQPASDPFIVDYVEDLRARTNNELIYAEQVDLSSTHSIRKFATKWIDNAPPRRLDMIILCAATLTPPGKRRAVTDEGLEETWMVNYLANFHLLGILSPAIRAQPPDRDVRIIFTTCSSYIGSPQLENGDEALNPKSWSPGTAYARSKLALMVFGQAFQKHLDAYERPDKLPMNARVIFVDPGYSRTAGMRRWLTRGSLWGLAAYVLLWHQAWLWLKSAQQGAQSVIYAAMEVTLGRGNGGKLIKECLEVDFARPGIRDEDVAKKLWEGSEKLLERVEREEAVRRALEKKEMDEKEKEKAAKVVETAADDAADVKSKKAKSRRKKKADKAAA